MNSLPKDFIQRWRLALPNGKALQRWAVSPGADVAIRHVLLR